MRQKEECMEVWKKKAGRKRRRFLKEGINRNKSEQRYGMGRNGGLEEE